MKILILKKFWMFLLTLTFLMSSKINSNADVLSLIDALTDEEVRIIHRALSNKCQVDWKKEFKLNTPYRKEKTRKVLGFLTAVYATKMAKSKQETLDYLKNFYVEEGSESDPIKLQYKEFMKKRCEDREAKLELGKGQLEGLLRNSAHDDRETFECLAREPDDFDGFVILEPTIASQELKIGQPIVDICTSSSSSSSASSSSSSSVASSSTPPTSVSDVSDAEEELLSRLDEKGAKIALRARLNNYQIPFTEFDFSVSEEVEKRNDAEKCNDVCDYLKRILQKKINNILEKKDKFSSASPEYDFYTNKHEKYEDIITAILVSFFNKTELPPTSHSASSSSSKSGISSLFRKGKSSSRRGSRTRK